MSDNPFWEKETEERNNNEIEEDDYCYNEDSDYIPTRKRSMLSRIVAIVMVAIIFFLVVIMGINIIK